MSKQRRIGIIGAGGWLGGAFLQGLVDADIVAVDQLTPSFRSRQPRILPHARWTRNNQELVDRSDVIIVSVRPQDFPALEAVTQGKLVVSVMAGITLSQLSRRFRTDRVVRALPNGAAEVRKSYTPWIASKGASAADRVLVQQMLEAVGAADEVATEADIDYLTGLTGSGPAFPALLAAAMMDDAERRGIDRTIARRCVNAVLAGAGRLVELHAESPDSVVRTFMDYRGTTAAAIQAMRDAGFETAVGKGLAAALQKSIEMGRDAEKVERDAMPREATRGDHKRNEK